MGAGISSPLGSLSRLARIAESIRISRAWWTWRHAGLCLNPAWPGRRPVSSPTRHFDLARLFLSHLLRLTRLTCLPLLSITRPGARTGCRFNLPRPIRRSSCPPRNALPALACSCNSHRPRQCSAPPGRPLSDGYHKPAPSASALNPRLKQANRSSGSVLVPLLSDRHLLGSAFNVTGATGPGRVEFLRIEERPHAP